MPRRTPVRSFDQIRLERDKVNTTQFAGNIGFLAGELGPAADRKRAVALHALDYAIELNLRLAGKVRHLQMLDGGMQLFEPQLSAAAGVQLHA